MELKLGDIVEFKKYEDMNDDERMWINRDNFPKSGKIALIENNGLFIIEGCEYILNPGSVARVISDVDGVDIDSLNPGDEVLVKATVNSCYDDTVFINPVERFLNKDDVLKVLKRKEPERFIVQEDYYGMYIGSERELVSDKSKAKLYASLDGANEAAVDMQLDYWDVIPYDD